MASKATFSSAMSAGPVTFVPLPGVLPDLVFTREYKLDWFGTARGRVGFLPAERLLLYATGGLAYGGFSGSSMRPATVDIGTWSRCRAGWTVGAGAEAALGSNWSVKFEYLYMDLGNVVVVQRTHDHLDRGTIAVHDGDLQRQPRIRIQYEIYRQHRARGPELQVRRRPDRSKVLIASAFVRT